jgi:hypothetical protein
MQKKSAELVGHDLEEIYMQFMAGHNGPSVVTTERGHA